MKRLLLAFLSAGLAFIAYGQVARQKIDADNGLYDAKLGSILEAHPEMVYIGPGGDNDPNMRYYQRQRDSLVFAAVPLSSVRYAYYKGKLASILVQADARQRVALRQVLVARYGKPIHYSKAYEWTGRRTTIVLDESDSSLSSVLIASDEFKRMTQARMKKQAKG